MNIALRERSVPENTNLCQKNTSANCGHNTIKNTAKLKLKTEKYV